MVLISGEPGTGKTCLLLELERLLHGAGRRVVRSGATWAAPTEGSLSGASGPDAVLLVDEADRLDDEAIRTLARGPFAGVVLAGIAFDAAFWADLTSDATWARIEPLVPSDAALFLAARLEDAGLPRDRIPADAVAALARRSGGVPRVLAILADASLALAALDGSPHVRLEDVEEAAALRDGGMPERTDSGPAPAETAQPVPDVPPKLTPPSRADSFAASTAAPAVAPRVRRGVLLPLLAVALLLVPAGPELRSDLRPDEAVPASMAGGWIDPSETGPSKQVESPPAADAGDHAAARPSETPGGSPPEVPARAAPRAIVPPARRAPVVSASGTVGRRCRIMAYRFQIGEDLSNAEWTFLRNGCVAG